MSARITCRRDHPADTLLQWSGAVVGETPGVSVSVEYAPGQGADALRILDDLVAEVRRDVEGAP